MTKKYWRQKWRATKSKKNKTENIEEVTDFVEEPFKSGNKGVHWGN